MLKLLAVLASIIVTSYASGEWGGLNWWAVSALIFAGSAAVLWWARQGQATQAEPTEISWRGMVNRASSAALLVDQSLHIVQANGAAATIFRLPSEAGAVGRALSDFLVDDVVDAAQVEASGPMCVPNVRIKCGDGSERWVALNAMPAQAGFLLLQLHDITENYQRLIGLEDSEQRYRLIAEHANDIISSHSLDGRIEFVSAACSRILGYSQEEMVGINPLDLVHPDDRLVMTRKHAEAITGGDGKSAQCRVRRKDGAYIWVELYGRLMPGEHDNPRGFVAVTRDITLRHAAEAAQRESERFRALFELARDELLLIDSAGRIVDVNRNTCERLGKSRGWLIGTPLAQLLTAAEADFSLAGLQDIYLRINRGEQVLVVAQQVGAEGEPIDVEALFSVIRQEGRNLMLVAVRDVSQRKRMERELIESLGALRLLHNRLFGIIEGTSDLIAALDGECRLIAFNSAFKQAFERKFGTPIQLGISLLELLVDRPEDMARALTNWYRALSGGVFKDTQVWEGASGNVEYYEVSYCPLRDEVGGVCGAAYIGRNVTQRTVAEEELKSALEQLETARSDTERANIQLKQANTELLRQANQDGMTGIANRRYFDEYLALEWRRASRQGESIALIFADVDFFKLYNDHYGHQAGDDCLRKVAAALASQLHRPADLLARYGGEEFVILLPNTSLAGAIFIAESMLKAVASMALPHARSTVAEHVTLSLGVAATAPTEAMAEGYLLYGADQALYAAKKGGRNKVHGSPI